MSYRLVQNVKQLLAAERGTLYKPHGDRLSFALDYLNVLKILDLAGLPLRASERDERYPLVIMGGPAPWVNPEAVAPFVDAIVIGEAEGLTDLLIPAIREQLAGSQWRDKREL